MTARDTAGVSTLDELRHQIDAVDENLLALLNKRAALSLKIGGLKKNTGAAVRHPGREKEIVRKLIEANAGPLLHGQIQMIYDAIFAVSRALQQPGASQSQE